MPQINDKVLETVLTTYEQAAEKLDSDSVPVYLFLAERFANSSDISSDHVFQFLFRSYYRLDNAGLTDDFKKEYFRLLQNHRHEQVPDLRQICRTLRAYKTKRGKQSLQFSFATKILATIDQDQPLYDRFVASVFGFSPPLHKLAFEERLEKHLQFYEALKETSRWLREQPELKDVDALFAKREKQWHLVGRCKQIDFILWATGKAMRA